MDGLEDLASPFPSTSYATLWVCKWSPRLGDGHHWPLVGKCNLNSSSTFSKDRKDLTFTSLREFKMMWIRWIEMRASFNTFGINSRKLVFLALESSMNKWSKKYTYTIRPKSNFQLGIQNTRCINSPTLPMSTFRPL